MNERVFVKQNPEGYVAYCEVCGEAYLLKTPMPMDEFGKRLKLFAKMHKDCKPKSGGNDETNRKTL